MLQNPIVLGVLVLVAVVALYRKGYISLPGKSAPSNGSGDLGRKFFLAVQQEAQNELADLVAGKLKDEVKAKLQAPFSPPAPSEPAKPGV